MTDKKFDDLTGDNSESLGDDIRRVTLTTGAQCAPLQIQSRLLGHREK